MSQNYKKTKNIPAFLHKLYTMLEVNSYLIPGWNKLMCHHVVIKWSWICHSKLGCTYKKNPSKVFQTLKLFFFHSPSKLFFYHLAQYV